SSTPTSAATALHWPFIWNTTSLAACVPSPDANLVPLTVSARPSPAAFSPLLMLRSTGPQPLVADTQASSPRFEVPCGSGFCPVGPADTRYSTVPCAGTDALIVPLVVRVALLHRSL